MNFKEQYIDSNQHVEQRHSQTDGDAYKYIYRNLHAKEFAKDALNVFMV